MKFTKIDPPRTFTVGKESSVYIRHCANIELNPDEQVTFMTRSGAEYDVVRKSWGYYATPSLNGRLRDFGLRAVLIRNKSGKAYLLLVEEGSETAFQAYLDAEDQEVVCWLDNDEAVGQVCKCLDQQSSER